MPLIDGKYEIISQLYDAGRESYYKASAADGSTVHIAWYKLSSPEDEQQFEQFRKLIRTLKRLDLAAVYDIVSRPGAHYVVWKDGRHLSKAKKHSAIDKILSEYGYKSNMADIRMSASGAQIFDLKFSRESIVVSKELKEFKPKKIKQLRKLRAFFFASLALLLSSLALLFLSIKQLTNSREVTLDNLIGYNVNEASRYLYSKQLKVSSSPSPSERPFAEVLAMDPPAGETIRPYYRTVHLVYSSPIGAINNVKVIDLVNKTFSADIVNSLEENSLHLGKLFYLSSDKAAKTIIAQSKTAGSLAAKGETIDLLISKGKEKKSFLPDLKGMSLEDARFFVGLSGLKVEEVFEKSKVAKNTVIGQSLAAFKPIGLNNSSIKLYISSGLDGNIELDKTDNQPNLVGLNRAEAERLAAELGYRIKVNEISAKNLPNLIVSQQFENNDENQAGVISLTLNNYIQPIDIPRPNIETEIFNNQVRNLDYSWAIEPNLSLSNYQVHAILSDGRTLLVKEGNVKGGEIVSGVWQSKEPGPVKFVLYLNGFQYSIEIVRN